MSEYPSPGDGRLTARDLWEILSLPMLLGLAAVAVTWLVWYVTSESCTPKLARTSGCNLSRIARYINLEVLNKIVTHAAIAAGGGGIWSYAVITRERRAREAAERRLAEVLAQAAEERAQAAEERRAREAAERRLAEVLAQAAPDLTQAAAERAQAAEERRQLAAEQVQWAAERRQLLSIIERLVIRLCERSRTPSPPGG